MLLLVIGSVAIVTGVYIALQFNLIAQVKEYPKITFWKWSTSEKKTNFDYSMNIFAGVKTVDENVTQGIFNDDSVKHQCYIRLKSLTNPANIAKLNITIYNGTNTIYTKEWTEFGTLPTPWENFITAEHAKYAIWIEITAAASPSGYSTFEVEVKEDNP